MGSRRSVVVLCQGGGHAQRLLPIVTGLVKRDMDVRVMTRAEVRGDVEAAGGMFVDLFAEHSLDAVDRESVPLPSRLVTFAAAYAEPLTRMVAAFEPDLLVYDSFVVVAPVIGRRLNVPYVGMRAGHAQVPLAAIAEIRNDPRVATSEACRAAVERLKGEYGVTDASPFSYLDGVSPFLNLYPEPPPFLDDAARRAFEPIAFVGSLAPEFRDARSRHRPFSGSSGRTRIYVSFGTAIWRYYADVALGALTRLAETLSTADAEILVSLGGYPADAAARRKIERANVRVETYVDQWGALKDADLFVTHHGLNSTHEAIFHRVPMLSYPFFGDQPAMARCCQDLGLALALVETPRDALSTTALVRRIDQIVSRRDVFATRLAEARQWELDTIDGRDAVLDRMLALA